MFSTILWATDGSPEADHALDNALELLAPGGRLIAFHADQRFVGSHVAGIPVLPDEPDRKERIAEQVHELRERGIDAELYVETTSGGPATAITDAAIDAGADMIVCGTRALHGVRGLLDGSVAAKVLRSATVPVVVVPPAKVGASV
jgi:nucleotide-binding universal stress UspA family protein